jgi:hypothetical protein
LKLIKEDCSATQKHRATIRVAKAITVEAFVAFPLNLF